LKSNLKAAFAAVADGLGEEIFFLLQREVDDAALGGVENAEGKGASVFADLVGGKARHRVKLGLARLAKALGVDDEAVLAIETSSHRLKEQDLERIQQLSVLGESKMRIVTL